MHCGGVDGGGDEKSIHTNNGNVATTIAIALASAGAIAGAGNAAGFGSSQKGNS